MFEKKKNSSKRPVLSLGLRFALIIGIMAIFAFSNTLNTEKSESLFISYFTNDGESLYVVEMSENEDYVELNNQFEVNLPDEARSVEISLQLGLVSYESNEHAANSTFIRRVNDGREHAVEFKREDFNGFMIQSFFEGEYVIIRTVDAVSRHQIYRWYTVDSEMNFTLEQTVQLPDQMCYTPSIKGLDLLVRCTDGEDTDYLIREGHQAEIIDPSITQTQDDLSFCGPERYTFCGRRSSVQNFVIVVNSPVLVQLESIETQTTYPYIGTVSVTYPTVYDNDSVSLELGNWYIYQENERLPFISFDQVNNGSLPITGAVIEYLNSDYSSDFDQTTYQFGLHPYNIDFIVDAWRTQ